MSGEPPPLRRRSKITASVFSISASAASPARRAPRAVWAVRSNGAKKLIRT